MTDDIIEVLDLGKKISLLLSNGFHQITTATKLADKSSRADIKKSGLNTSEISRFRTRGDNRININKFKGLCAAYPQIPEQLWHQPLEIFAQELELSFFEKPALTMRSPHQPQIPMMGIDFKSRIKDKELLERRFEIMKGYWEVFNYSISIKYKKCITYDILELKKLTEDGFIECLTYGYNYQYHGHCFFVGSITYFMMEEYNLLNEIAIIMTNAPDRSIHPLLSGIVMFLSGGSHELVSIPSAAKILLRHVGSIHNVKEKYAINGNFSIPEMIEKIEEKINLDTTQLSDILPLIDNHIPQDAVPYALRAKLF